jgi:hypothetical protein
MMSLTLFDVYPTSLRPPIRYSTFVFKTIADLVAPFIVELFNRSLAADHFPIGFKDAFIIPLMQKPGLDATDVNSYRPISNLSIISKLLERLAVRQLMEYLTSAGILSSLQSGFQPGHLTETAVLRVLPDVLVNSSIAKMLLR